MSGNTQLRPAAWFRRLTLVLTLMLAALLVAACGGANRPLADDVVAPPAGEPTEAAPAAADVDVVEATEEPVAGAPDVTPFTVTLNDIADDPARYVGARVSIVGDVTEIVDQRAFILSDPVLGGVDSLLVIGVSENAIPADLSADGTVNSQVEVVGVVRNFDQPGIQEELGYQFDNETGDFSGRPIIIASVVQMVDGS